MKKSLSVIVPAYNEEKNISGTINSIKQAITNIEDYEIIVINDCSSDNTGKLIDKIASKDKHVKVFHNSTNMGLGYNYIKGIRLSTKNYLVLVPGDNEIASKGLVPIFNSIGDADLIIPYPANPEIRPFIRRVISRTFVMLMNFITGINLRYYNGLVVHKKSIISRVKITTFGFAYQAEILSKLIKAGYSYKQVKGMDLKSREHGSTKIFRPRNVFSVIKTIFFIFYNLRFKNKKLYNKKPIEII